MKKVLVAFLWVETINKCLSNNFHTENMLQKKLYNLLACTSGLANSVAIVPKPDAAFMIFMPLDTHQATASAYVIFKVKHLQNVII